MTQTSENTVDDFKLTILEVANLLDRHRDTVMRLIKSKDLIAEMRSIPRNDTFKHTKKYLISEKSVEAYIDGLKPVENKTVNKPAFSHVNKVVNKPVVSHFNKIAVNKPAISYNDKIEKIHNLVEELGGLESFKNTFNMYCFYKNFFEMSNMK
jgi:hypothetical protein